MIQQIKIEKHFQKHLIQKLGKNIPLLAAASTCLLLKV
jgi:hypothetical protein